VAALLLAGLLSLFAISYAVRALLQCRRRREVTQNESDELELKLAAKEQKLELGLARRNVEALGRAALFGGTGCAVWELTGGSAHYLQAGAAFGLGLFGWAGCGELQRRIGSLADSRRS
jgi:hypothetical protein